MLVVYDNTNRIVAKKGKKINNETQKIEQACDGLRVSVQMYTYLCVCVCSNVYDESAA